MGHILSLAWASDLCGPIVFMQARRTLDRVLGPDMRRVKFASNNIPLQIWRVSDRQTGRTLILSWVVSLRKVVYVYQASIRDFAFVN